MQDSLRRRFLDAIIYRARCILWWPGAGLSTIGIVGFTRLVLAERGRNPTHLTDELFFTPLYFFASGSVILLVYWILSGHLYPPIGRFTAWAPLTKEKWRELDEVDLAYGFLDKDGFELACGGVLVLILGGVLWLVLPIILSTALLFVVLMAELPVDTRLVYWSLLMLCFSAQRAISLYFREGKSMWDMLSVDLH